MKGGSSVAFSLFAKANFKMLLVGDKDAGKTSLVVRYVKHTFLKAKSVTSGIDFYSKTLDVGKDEIALQIWDTAAANLHSLAKSFYQQASCVFVVYSDAANLQTTLDRYLLQINEYASAAVVIVVVRSRVDENPVTAAEKAVLQSFVKNHQGVQLWAQTSAITGQGVDELFSTVASALYARYNQDEAFKELVDPKKDSFMLRADDMASKKAGKKRCCS